MKTRVSPQWLKCCLFLDYYTLLCDLNPKLGVYSTIHPYCCSSFSFMIYFNIICVYQPIFVGLEMNLLLEQQTTWRLVAGTTFSLFVTSPLYSNNPSICQISSGIYPWHLTCRRMVPLISWTKWNFAFSSGWFDGKFWCPKHVFALKLSGLKKYNYLCLHTEGRESIVNWGGEK